MEAGMTVNEALSADIDFEAELNSQEGFADIIYTIDEYLDEGYSVEYIEELSSEIFTSVFSDAEELIVYFETVVDAEGVVLDVGIDNIFSDVEDGYSLTEAIEDNEV